MRRQVPCRAYSRKSEGAVWVAGGCKSWYLDKNGVNRAAWPASTLNYWLRTRRVKASDYELFEQPDRVSVTGLAQLAPGKPADVVIHKPGGKTVAIQCRHTLTDEQIGWFKAGSALNALK